MPKTALIIEDDESTGKLLSTLCGKLEVEATVVKNGKDGFEKARSSAPDLLMLDLLVPGMDGFKIAEALKAASQLPKLIVVSGVYKDAKIAKELSDKYAADFFQKPFKNDEVLAAIGHQLGLSVPEQQPAPRPSGEVPAVQIGPMQGSLRSKPFALLLMELFRAKASGTLDLAQGQIRKRIYLNRGMVRFAQSNVKAENVGGIEVAEGTITEKQFQQAVARARTERIGIGEALALSGAISYDALTKATRRQVEDVCVSACAWQDGTFQLTPGNTDKIQDARHDPIAIVLSGYKRHATADQARALLAPMGKAIAGRGPEFDRSLFVLRSVFPGETLTPMVNGRLKIEEILARARTEDLPLLLALVQLEIASLSGLDASVSTEGMAHRHVTAAPSRPYTPEERASRDMIEAEHARVMAARDFFGVLGLQRGASVEQVKAAYLPLAKRLHVDAFAGQELGDATDKLRELFGRISEAHATLADPKRRADYDVLLERKDAGLPTDMEVIFKAEAAFNRSDALMKQGRFNEAEAAVREALKLDPSVAQYHVALGQALLKGRGAPAAAEARAAIDKALALSPEAANAKVLKATALGMEGDLKSAEALLREVLANQPDDAEAMREYRALKERSKKGENKGLLGRLFKR
jgi:CheY-like chemotaxis protein/curved DNA-binding protein CbpA